VFTVFLCSANFGFGQSISESFALAQKLFEAGNYQGALTLYDRVVFFDHGNEFKCASYKQIAQCYLMNQAPNKAFTALDLAFAATEFESEKNEILLQKSLYLVQEKYWMRALQELYALKNLSPEQNRLCNYLLGTCLFATGDFEKSESYFLLLVNEKDAAEIEEIFDKATKKLNPKKVQMAKTVSYFVPGSGQILAGNVKSGVNSILLIGGLGALYFSAVNNYGLLSGMITILPWLSRYHLGGAENAEESMINRQEKLKSKYFNEIISIVRN